ncbi:hypothetical protein [Bacillus coahuilensis]|uniref:hypothetical protein n=1 Tax=Bacillus coahuilensis TaxID=408580 RepID=UPI0001850DF2|nr:hypothetical protein [Bacillus coahuilensis]
MYLESDQENEIKGFVLEWDEVFSTYTILVGLPVKKKHTQNVKDYLQNTVQGNFNVMYDDGEGFLDVNVSIASLHTIKEEMTIRQVSEIVTNYIDQLMTVTKEA